MTIEELAKMEAAMTKGPWEFEWEGARHAEESESAAVVDDCKLFDTLNRDYRLSESSRLDNDESGLWFDTGGGKDIEGVVAMRNHFRALLEVARAAAHLLEDLDGAEIEGTPSDELRAALAALKEQR